MLAKGFWTNGFQSEQWRVCQKVAEIKIKEPEAEEEGE